jgi:hypothetical protein
MTLGVLAIVPVVAVVIWETSSIHRRPSPIPGISCFVWMWIVLAVQAWVAYR